MAGIPCGAVTGWGGTDGGAAAGCRDGGGWRTAVLEDGRQRMAGWATAALVVMGGGKKEIESVCLCNEW